MNRTCIAFSSGRAAGRVTWLAVCLISGLIAASSLAAKAMAEDWPTYMHDSARSAASGETWLSSSNAANLVKSWSFKTGGGVASSPTVVGGIAYFGSWDGYEYAVDATTGALKWKTFIGITDYGVTNCAYPTKLGVTSSAAVQNGVVYVGGGDSYWYALSASNGSVLWRVFTGDNSATGGHYNWASPLLYNGSAYIGIASLDDCPLVQGQLLRVNLSTHQIVATWNAVPNGQVGGGIWTSPTVDSATNTLYMTTGTQALASQTTSAAFVSLDATSLALKGAWQIPVADQVDDGDWGTTPNLLPGGLAAATNKNGITYAFQRSNVSAGPVWQHRIANGGSCPVCGDGSVSSGAVGGGVLFAAGGYISTGNTNSNGSVTAFNPATGTVRWTHGTQGVVIPGLAYVNGVVLAGAGSDLVALDAASGKQLFDYSTAGSIFSAPSVSGGKIFVGSQDGNLYAFGIGSNAQPPSTMRINAGGGNYMDGSGNTWLADCCNNGGHVFTTTSPIAGTSDPALYQSERWNAGPFTYTIPNLAAGNYQVTLKFAETAGLAPGQRQFNVSINGTQVLTNFDVAAQVGQDKALDKTFTATASNGQIAVSFTQGAADNPIVSAIQVVPAPTSPPPPNTVRVNAGGGSYTDGSGNTWQADCCNSGGNVFTTTSAIAGTSDPALYQSERWNAGPFTYTFPNLASGNYQVTLKFAETAGLGSGQRQFNVSINGTPVLTNFDVAAQVGDNKALDKTFTTTSSNGQIAVSFTRGAADNPIVSAIQVVPAPTSPPPPNTVRVNAGGGSYTDGSGNTWQADCCNSGGNVFSTTNSIAGTSDPTLYQSERWNAGPFTYTFSNLAAGSYQVTLKFAEIAWLGPGQRQFNVSINGTPVLTNFDVAAQVGDNKALDKTFTATATNGQITISFTQGAADNPIVSAIQIVPAV